MVGHADRDNQEASVRSAQASIHVPGPTGPTRVVHCKRAPYDVYIGRGRGSRWGNPFVIGRDGDRAEVIEKYERWLATQPELLAAVPELRGRTPGCWCAPRPCHGDVLARLADATG